ncbi:hypothetical protein J8F10_14440 [Gemmata sp. G18]|uniref:Lipoprotein SmpA/OmlA domain-containing protein n=1 Tax=Gemmata palustris TaxID=2822762 RepID=A0ABS5BRY5_9BACT|nr:hypothetical protein [Gemmata palustris]MBP3956476.1 hypothetical protein [Gemmata palustris]
MRAVVVLTLFLSLSTGCNKEGGPTVYRDPVLPGKGPAAVEPHSDGKVPPPHEPSKKLTLKEAREKIVQSAGNEGLKRDEVKKLLGAPDETQESKFGPNKFFSDVWIYRNQTVIWDGASEKFYPLIRITFIRNVDRPAQELRID